MAYSSAIEDFNDYLGRKYKPEAEARLADSYRRINDFESAEYWYSKVVEQPEIAPVNYLNYGKVLMSRQKYEHAKKWFKSYLEEVPDDLVAEMLLASCYSVNSFMEDTTLYSLKEIQMPMMATAFGQVPYEDGLMFVGDKVILSNSKTYEWTGRSYLDIFFSRKDYNGRWLNPMALKGNINGRFHEGPACFTQDGKTVYFTRSSAQGRKAKRLERSKLNENNLKIYKAELVGEDWKNVEELPFNSNEYSCAHPCLAPDGNTMYFVSDKPGGFGGADIYKSTRDGICWSRPENLGGVVNTAGNEVFPYMYKDGTLYFSSDSHHNLGGLDVFMTSWTGEKWLAVENLNYPLNSSFDDFAFVKNGDQKSAYVSSNRNSSDKMYEVTLNGPTFMLTGQVTVRGTGKPVDSALVEVMDNTHQAKKVIFTGKNGYYKTQLEPETDYSIRASKRMHYPVKLSKHVSTAGKKTSDSYIANFQLEQIIVEKPIVLENIYYDLDKWAIRPDAAQELNKIVTLMNENPWMLVELRSHTDSRASDQYNLVLSDKRAHAAVNYLVRKGIQPERLRWKAFGETMIINRCKNGVACSEAEHQQNRRTEFVVIKHNIISGREN
jgi:outer membrane protein OmpA-like peptidoglycan-associated protein/tetratricopeptide (TPR) repeat protein